MQSVERRKAFGDDFDKRHVYAAKRDQLQAFQSAECLEVQKEFDIGMLGSEAFVYEVDRERAKVLEGSQKQVYRA